MLSLQLHEIVEGLHFHCSLSVCVSVCHSLCQAILVIKILAKRMLRSGRGFHKTIAYHTGSNPIDICDLGSKVKVTVLCLDCVRQQLSCIMEHYSCVFDNVFKNELSNLN